MRKRYIVFAFLLSLVIVSCKTSDGLDLESISNKLTIGYQTGETINTVKSNITLPKTIDGYDVSVTWESNHVSITNEGVVTQQESDTLVTLSATIKSKNDTFIKPFIITVLAKKGTTIMVNYNYTLHNKLKEVVAEQLSLVESKLKTPDGYVAEDTRLANFVRANLWTYSAYFTTVVQNYMMNPTNENKALLDKATEELEWYKATHREDEHLVYASKNGYEEPAFFDDNVWLVIGFINAYNHTKEAHFLDKALKVQEWIYTGWQEEGGLYWREFPESYEDSQKVRNTCINGPAAWAAMLLYEATNDFTHLDWAIKIYTWTKYNLYDKENKVYWDNISKDGIVNKWTFTYNTGTMMSAASLLYKHTLSDIYKEDVQNLMDGSHEVFYIANQFQSLPNGEFYKDNPWFRVYLVQGFYDAMRYVDVNYGIRLERVKNAILYGLENHIDERGFLWEDWSGRIINEGPSNKDHIRTLFAVGNTEILAILAQYEAYLKEVTS